AFAWGSEGLGFESQCVHFGHPSAGGCQRSTGDPRLILGKGYRLVVLGGYGRTDPLLNKPFYPNVPADLVARVPADRVARVPADRVARVPADLDDNSLGRMKGVAAEKPAAPVARETVAPVAREPVAPVAREPVAPVARLGPEWRPCKSLLRQQGAISEAALVRGPLSEGLGFESQCVHFGHPSAGGCQRSTGDPRLILGKGYRLVVLGERSRVRILVYAHARLPGGLWAHSDPLLNKPFYPNGLVVGILTFTPTPTCIVAHPDIAPANSSGTHEWDIQATRC
ncbi:unnamed protein product, partial [Closterium sp. NIES-54]